MTSLGIPDIQGTASLELAKNVVLGWEVYFETRGNGAITIGENTRVGNGVLCISHAQIRIGAGVILGNNALLRDILDPGERTGKFASAVSNARPIIIGNEVWIGSGTTILPGVHLADGVVVGSNSVVTADVPAGLVVAGIPARPVQEWLGRHRHMLSGPNGM